VVEVALAISSKSRKWMSLGHVETKKTWHLISVRRKWGSLEGHKSQRKRRSTGIYLLFDNNLVRELCLGGQNLPQNNTRSSISTGEELKHKWVRAERRKFGKRYSLLFIIKRQLIRAFRSANETIPPQILERKARTN
jgi:hypothetical protein